MFGFMKSRDEKRKKEKLEKEQKRSAQSLTADELIRLEEAKQAMDRKTSNGASADSHSIASSEASTDRIIGPQRDGSQRTRPVPVKPTRVPPKPPKKGILKDKSSYGGQILNQGVHGNLDDSHTLEANTLANEALSGVNSEPSPNVRTIVSSIDHTPKAPPKAPTPVKKPKPSLGTTRSSPKTNVAESPSIKASASSLPPTYRPPSPAEKSYDVDLHLPTVAAPLCPKSRELVLQRQATGDFGFTLRKGIILERGTSTESGTAERKRQVIFAEPGPKNLNIGLLPGDRLIEINGVNVENMTRESIIEIIKSCGDSVRLRVQTIPELSELSMRTGAEDGEDAVETHAASSGTLKRSGSLRYQGKQVDI